MVGISGVKSPLAAFFNACCSSITSSLLLVGTPRPSTENIEDPWSVKVDVISPEDLSEVIEGVPFCLSFSFSKATVFVTFVIRSLSLSTSPSK